MRTKEEVKHEIEWREEEISKLETTIHLAIDACHIDFARKRITTLKFAISWCKWFLNN